MLNQNQQIFSLIQETWQISMVTWKPALKHSFPALLPYQAHASDSANFSITKHRYVEVAPVWIHRGPVVNEGG